MAKSTKDNVHDLKEDEISLVFVNAMKYDDVLMRLFGECAKKKDHTVIYIAANKPADIVLKKMTERKISSKNIFTIDTVTKMMKEATRRVPNTLFTSSPENLTELSIAISQVLKNTKGKKCLVLDSVSILMMYNNFEMVMKFMHFLIYSLEKYDAGAVLITMKNEIDPKLKSHLGQLCDRVMVIDK